MLSVVIAWRDREELAQALPNLVDAARGLGGEVTVVNYGGDREQLGAQLAGQREFVNVVELADERYFHKARAQNLGAFRTRRPVLFFCDCDIVVDAQTVRRVATAVRERDGVFATLAEVRESERNARGARHVVSFGYELNIRTADGRRLTIIDHEEDAADGTRQAPGLLFVRRSDFVAVDGYNGGLHGWGWEDQDMIARLTLGRGLSRLCEGTALHLSHDDAARIAHYPPVKDRWESRDRMFRAALANYDQGNFSGTFAADVATLGTRVR